MHLALGDGELASFKLSDFGACEPQIDRLFDEFISTPVLYPPADTYPEPLEHCAVCRWRVDCMGVRRRDDDLSLIAGVATRQRNALKRSGISTRRGLAGFDAAPELYGVSRVGISRVHAQASIQVQGEDAGKPRWELIEPERADGALVPDRGQLVLQEPADDDLFFEKDGSRDRARGGDVRDRPQPMMYTCDRRCSRKSIACSASSRLTSSSPSFPGCAPELPRTRTPCERSTSLCVSSPFLPSSSI